MNHCDAACEILRATSDGNELSGFHLGLVEAAVSGSLNESGERAFEELHDTVITGRYRMPFLQGIEYLTKDHQGYVYWKGQQVDHFSFEDPESEKLAAEALAAACRTLEAKGFPINARTASSREVVDAPKDSPWIEALCHYYTFFVNEDRVKAIFYKRTGRTTAIVMEKRKDGSLEIEIFPDPLGAYDAYHAVRQEGFTSSAPYGTYEQIVLLLERSKLTPQEIHRAIA